MTYQDGFKKAQEDYAAGMGPMILRGYSVDFRNGYSDGWWKTQGAKKL